MRRPAVPPSAVPTLPVLPRTVTDGARCGHCHRTTPRPRARRQHGRRQGRGQHAIEPIEQTTMTGNELAGILHLEAALERSSPADRRPGRRRRAAADQGRAPSGASIREAWGSGKADRDRRDQATHRAGPCFPGRDARRKPGAADHPADQIRADIAAQTMSTRNTTLARPAIGSPRSSTARPRPARHRRSRPCAAAPAGHGGRQPAQRSHSMAKPQAQQRQTSRRRPARPARCGQRERREHGGGDRANPPVAPAQLAALGLDAQPGVHRTAARRPENSASAEAKCSAPKSGHRRRGTPAPRRPPARAGSWTSAARPRCG